MPFDTFARIGDIKGESVDEHHRGEIDVLSWAWGVTQATAAGYGAGAGSGKASFHDFTFTHPVDRASPLLMRACATGQHIQDGVVTVRRAGAASPDFLVITMEDVIVTSVAESGPADAAPVESVTLAFAKVDYEYRTQAPDGSPGDGVHFAYDIKARREP